MTEIQSPTLENPKILVPVDAKIEEYMLGLLGTTDHPVLLEMEALARTNKFPIIERLVGVFLETLAKSISAKRIFEFGSGFGYSAYWFARAAGNQGEVICSDGDPSNRTKAKQHLSAAGLWNNIDFQIGNGSRHFRENQWIIRYLL